MIELVKYQFGFHVGGVDDNGISHNAPQGAAVLFSPVHGDDDLPDTEFVAYDWYSYDLEIRQKVSSLLAYLDLVMDYGDFTLIELKTMPSGLKLTVRTADGLTHGM
jgi:hypothetical protein